MEDFLSNEGIISEKMVKSRSSRDESIGVNLLPPKESQISTISNLQPPQEIKIKKKVTQISEDILFQHCKPLNARVWSTIVSKNDVYYVGESNNKLLLQYSMISKETTSYPCKHFENCRSINYNPDLNWVTVTVKGKGVYWFEPGKETVISKIESFPALDFSDTLYKIGMVFNGVQGILKANNRLFLCPNMVVDTDSIIINLPSQRIVEAIFLDK